MALPQRRPEALAHVAVPERVDLAVIVTPASSVPALIGECADAQVHAAIIISAGFKEMGSSGLELERQVLEQARRGGMRLIGPINKLN